MFKKKMSSLFIVTKSCQNLYDKNNIYCKCPPKNIEICFLQSNISFKYCCLHVKSYFLPDCHNKEMTNSILVIRLEPSRWVYCIPHSWVVHWDDERLTWTASSTDGINLSLQFRAAKDNGMKKWKCTQTLDSKHYTGSLHPEDFVEE